MMKNTKIIIMAVAAVVIIGGTGFFGGLKYQESKTPKPGLAMFNNTRTQNRFGGTDANSRNFNPANAQRFRPVIGDILSSDDTSITVKLTDGSSKIVLLGDSTSITQTSEASKADLTEGTKVGVFGTMMQNAPAN